ncbi:MAG TPA: trypsin-like peptidase domain-containing protein [Gemmatimonadaceae bacterium]|nr:trypsin-like peptidase domain-containing protein [Gemmatimonadaceae bacterium]
MMRRRAIALAAVATLTGCKGTPQVSAAQIADSLSHVSAAHVSESRRTAITQAVARVAPAVVTVQTEAVERVQTDPLYDWFMGGGSQTRVVPGLGSGFVVRNDGVIVTNAHVIANARTISVMMRDGRVYPAQRLGSDETNDIAVIKIDAKNLPVATLGNSSQVLIGEWAIAIGNPYGFVLGNPEPTVTTGVISGVGRNLLARGEGAGAYLDMIQTDASINPGNSGGPLVNADGEVIGVNSSIYTPSGGSVGIGFAIPINRAERVVEDLLSPTHAVRRPWVGVRLRYPRTDNVREAIASGAIVASVTPGSPAAKAGIQAGDVLLQAGERAIRNPFDWEAELLDLRVGETVPVRFRRGSRDVSATVTVQEVPEATAPKVQVLRDLQLVTLTDAMRAERGIRSRTGALIVNVGDTMASELGVQPGDVIVQINRTPVRTAQDVANALDYYGQQGAIRMFVEREGAIYTTDFVIR